MRMLDGSKYLVAALALATFGCDPPNPQNQVGAAGAGQGPQVTDAMLRIVAPVDIKVSRKSLFGYEHEWAVSGAIQYRHPQSGEPGILSDGYGGACLLVKQPKTCQTANDCTRTPDGAAYCLDKKITHSTIAGQCWVRGPDIPWCLKSVTDLPESDRKLELNKTYNVPKQGSVSIRDPATVRLLTCLNPPRNSWPKDDKGNPEAPCASGKPVRFTFRVCLAPFPKSGLGRDLCCGLIRQVAVS
jgi:hypothetical protein